MNAFPVLYFLPLYFSAANFSLAFSFLEFSVVVFNFSYVHPFVYSFIYLYSFIVTCQNARTYIIYGNVNELYDLKKFFGLFTLRITNVLVKFAHRDKTEKPIIIYNG